MKRFAEIGTGSGVSSVYVAISARMRNGALYTVDVTDRRAEAAKLVWADHYMIRRYEDFMASLNSGECAPLSCEAQSQTVVGDIKDSDIWLVNNNTNTTKVALLYADVAPVGSICVVHGFTMDRRHFDSFDAIFRLYGYESVFREFAESLGTHMRAWKRVATRAPPEDMVKRPIHHSNVNT